MGKKIETHNDLIQWIKTAPTSEVQDFIKSWLIQRREEKHLCFGLCQVELRSLRMPGINFLNKLFGDYYEVCKDLQLINKYQNFVGWDNQIKLNKKRKIFIDSREKTPLKFKNVTGEIKALKYGDYIFSDSNWSGQVAIERKSMTDFIGTLSRDLPRFEKELQKAKDDEAYMIILVEENLSNAIDFKKKCSYLHYSIRVPPEFIFHRVRELIQKFNNIQFLFVNSHEDAQIMVEKLFSFGAEIKKYDLQLLHDSKII